VTLMWALAQPAEQLGIMLYLDTWPRVQIRHFFPGDYYLSENDRSADRAGRGLQILRELRAFWLHPDANAQATYNGILEAAVADPKHPVHGRRFTMYDFYRAVRRGSFFSR
jgi:hypothetical protein